MKSPAIDVTIATYYRCGCGAVLTAGGGSHAGIPRVRPATDAGPRRKW